MDPKDPPDDPCIESPAGEAVADTLCCSTCLLPWCVFAQGALFSVCLTTTCSALPSDAPTGCVKSFLANESLCAAQGVPVSSVIDESGVCSGDGST